MATYFIWLLLLGVTLPNVLGAFNPCKHGCPYVDPVTKVQAFCGLGPSAVACPVSHWCNVDPADAFAVCCQSQTGICPHGEPLVDLLTGKDVFCGRGFNRKDCPTTHACHIDSHDAFAVCCPKDPVKC